MSNWERIRKINEKYAEMIEGVAEESSAEELFRFVEEMYRVYTPDTVKIEDYGEYDFNKLFKFPNDNTSSDENCLKEQFRAYQKYIEIRNRGDQVRQSKMGHLKNKFIVEYGDVLLGLQNFNKCFDSPGEKQKVKGDYKTAIEYLEKNLTEPENTKLDKNAFIVRLHNFRDEEINNENYVKELLNTAAHINDDKFRFLYELIQNADDCDYPDGAEKCFTLKIDEIGESDNNEKKRKQMTVSYPENGMTNADVISITTIGESAKIKRRKQKKLIGEKGRGFHTIFSCCDKVKIYSNGFNFSMNSKEIQPNLIKPLDKGVSGTTMVMILKDKITVEKKENTEPSNKDQKTETEEQESKVASITFDDIVKNYGVKCDNNGATISKQDIINNCPILFTNKIEKIVIQGGQKVLQIKRTYEENSDVKNTGEMTVEYFYSRENEEINEENDSIGKVKLFFFNKDVEVDYGTYNGRYPEIFSEEEYKNADQNLKTYTITIACPIEIESNEKSEDKIVCGKLYSFMPTSVKLNAPIIINIPAKLTENRGCIVTPNDKGFISKEGEGWIAWNELFLKSTFKTEDGNNSALKRFYEAVRDNEKLNVMNYLPDIEEAEKAKCFFCNDDNSGDLKRLNVYCEGEKSEDCDKQLCIVKDEYKNNINIFKVCKTDGIESESDYVSASSAFVLDKFMHDTFKDVLENSMLDGRKYVDYDKFNDNQVEKAINMGVKQYNVEGEKLSYQKDGTVFSSTKYVFVNEVLKKSQDRDNATRKIINEISNKQISGYINTNEPSKLEIVPVKTSNRTSFISAKNTEDTDTIFIYSEDGFDYIPSGVKYKIIDKTFFSETGNNELYEKFKKMYKNDKIVLIEMKESENTNIINSLNDNEKNNIEQNFIDVFSIMGSIIKSLNDNEENNIGSIENDNKLPVWYNTAKKIKNEIYSIVRECKVGDDSENKLLFEKLGLIRYYKEDIGNGHKMRLLPDKWDREIRDLIRRGIQDEE